MKIYIKLIICILIILSVIPSAYAYWTDKVNTEVNLIITYDAELNILNVPVPVAPLVEEIPPQAEEMPPQVEEIPPQAEEMPPQVEEIPPQVEEMPLHGGSDAADDVKTQETEIPNPEISDTDGSGSPDAEAEGGDDIINYDSSAISDTETEESDNNMDLSSENSDMEKVDIQDSHVENEQ